MIECQICLNDNKRVRRMKCEYCTYGMCETCLVTMGGLSCPNCSKTWTRSFIVENTTGKTATCLLKTKQADVLFDQMVATIPTSQAVIMAAIDAVTYRREHSELVTALKEAREVYLRAKQALRVHTYRVVRRTIAPTNSDFRCPLGACMGMIVGGKCTLCTQTLCMHCRDVLADGHVCNADTVASVLAIRRDTKPCPKCASPIIKSEGCDQMYCTKAKCETFFSWSTGQITRGYAHNPEYTRFLEAGGRLMREAEDEVCGGMPATIAIRNAFASASRPTPVIGHDFDILTYVQYFNHIIGENLVTYGARRRLNTAPILVQYAMHRISAQKAKSLLVQSKKESEFNTELFNLGTGFSPALVFIMPPGRVAFRISSITAPRMVPSSSFAIWRAKSSFCAGVPADPSTVIGAEMWITGAADSAGRPVEAPRDRVAPPTNPPPE